MTPENQLDRIEQRLDGIDKRFDGIDKRFDDLTERMATKAGLAALGVATKAQLEALDDKIRLVAEGLDRIEKKVDDFGFDQQRQDKVLERHDLRLLRLESRRRK
jgi:tetrahydromethanopterin S-methyltransferase subunit G